MARPIWTGAVSFGLVSIPVKLYSATQDRSVRFHQIDGRTGSRVRQKRVSEADGSEV
ncbi:MAG: Ku protein, partial [Acidimicrobiales bacterium]|nr:Ku protein [Acidimicrobiales bacterium]